MNQLFPKQINDCFDDVWHNIAVEPHNNFANRNVVKLLTSYCLVSLLNNFLTTAE